VTLNTSVSQTSYGTTETIFGSGYIVDRLGRLTFRITPESFFQTNTRQAAALVDCVVGLGGFTKADRVFDLYCGTGTIALCVAEHVASVVGVEVIEQAVDAARTNATDNGVRNVVFERGDIVGWFDNGLCERHGRPDAVIVDPPRAGLHPHVVSAIAGLNPERIVYVSCNPQTMARDIEQLVQQYTVDRVQPVDMFPHTHHIEAVARLTRRAA
jgi:23S rRNA (uracil1939-C5)-methyltransferase